MDNLVEIRLMAYKKHRQRAWEHMPSLGIRHVGLITTDVDTPESMSAMRKRLDESGLKVATVLSRCDLCSPAVADNIRTDLALCQQLGAAVMCYAPPDTSALERDEVYARLRRAGETAAEMGLKICLETHPDLGTNGDIARATMVGVGHPNIRFNFDPANLYHFNENPDPLAELAKVVKFVGSVHLKDRDASNDQAAPSPPLGQGLVDFPALFAMLARRGFTGPYSLELEGMVEAEEPVRLKLIADSVAYLREIGALNGP
jgi:sugar phosphate isomerase/epimerase